MASSEHYRIYVFDQPRTCSMLFHRLLSGHPQLGHIFHSFSGTNSGKSPDIRGLLSPEPQNLARDTHDNTSTKADSEVTLRAKINDIEQAGKISFFKDHLFSLMRQDVMLLQDEDASDKGNPTRRFSDGFLLSITHSVFLTRHPAFIIRSFWDAQQTVSRLQPDEPIFMSLTTLRWTSILYDWYRAHRVQPIVIDVYDVVYNITSTMQAFCSIVGIDPAGICYEWPTQQPEGHMSKMFMQRLQGSTGVNRESETLGKDFVGLAAQIEGRRQEWGEDVALQLGRSVEEELLIYEQMKATALRLQ